jgi:hypothetical protein
VNSSTKGLYKNEGYFIDRTNPNGLVFIDPWWKCDRDVNNSNIVIMGVSGAGMSFTTKLKIARKRGINYGKEA